MPGRAKRERVGRAGTGWLAEASGVEEVLAVFLAAEVQREEGPLGVAAQRAAEGLFARAHHVLARILTAEKER